MVEDAPFVAQPNRTFCQSKAPTPAQIQRQKQRQSEEQTCRIADAGYQRQYRHAQVTIVSQKVRADAMRVADMEMQPLQPQSQQKQPLTKAPKASEQKPTKHGKPATRSKNLRARSPSAGGLSTRAHQLSINAWFLGTQKNLG